MKHPMNYLYRSAIVAVAMVLCACGETTNDLPTDERRVLREMSAPEPVPGQAVRAADSADTAVVTQAVVVRTSKGDFTIGLYGQDAPKTVANFVGLIKRKYYDGILVHRVARDFVIQAGDPKTRDASARATWGMNGQTADGAPLPEELDPAMPSARAGYQPGVVAMARKQAPSTGTSQFFVCLDRATVLPHQYTIFGRVIAGFDVVRSIGSVEVEPGPLSDTDGIPREPITIKSIRLFQPTP
ncbi:MAG: peptidylprolyl isomerase [Candidatus Kapabacteria bacterium]|nr:peptidylprolyl isomerase [Candidatus Kapabacteria bacterium]